MEIDDIKILIAARTAVLLYFYNDSCAPCILLRPKVGKLIESDFPNIELRFINSEHYPLTTAEFSIFSSPTILVFFEGKEYIRESKNISISELHDKIDRYYRMIF